MSPTYDPDGVWFTYKSRIISERRLRFYSLVGHLTITWYSFLLIVLSVFQEQLGRKFQSDVVNGVSIVLSVLLFGLSLLFYGLKFDERASLFRECYLCLHELIQSGKSDEEKSREYHRLLKHFPNHPTRDYDDVIFEAWRRGETLTNSAGEIGVTVGMIVRGYARIVWKWGITVAIFCWPFILTGVLLI